MQYNDLLACIHFHGDRSSRTVRLGRWLRKHGIMVTVGLWDGYKSTIYWRRYVAHTKHN